MPKISSFSGRPGSGGTKPSGSGRPVRGLSGKQLKIIAGVMLFFQVASTTVVPCLTGKNYNSIMTLTLAVVCELVSWAAIPIYAWLLVEGVRHTASVSRYLLRLVVLAVICEVPYDLVTFGRPWEVESQNPVWALVLGLVVLLLMRRVRDRFRAGSTFGAIGLGVVFALAGVVWALLLRLGTRQGLMPTGAILVVMVVIFYLLELRENTMMMLAGLVGALSLVAPAIGVAFLHYRNETLGYDTARTQLVLYAIYPVELLVGLLFSLSA